MRFLAPFGLLVALAIIGPLAAHLLRRRRPDEQPFAATELVPDAPPVARRRARLEDRSLLALRALAILLLSLVAASPLVRCSRLSIARRAGASVALAIVLDDSTSMSAMLPTSAQRAGAHTRLDLAVIAARDLTSSLRSGDAVSVVMAGAPARVLLAPTTDLLAVGAAIDLLDKQLHDPGSDRATDLDGALVLATSTLRDLPQPDRRVVVLSDLADGHAGEPPLSLPHFDGPAIELQAPVAALQLPPPQGDDDCALIAATLLASHAEGKEGENEVHAKIACGHATAATPIRPIEIVRDDASHAIVASSPTPPRASGDAVAFEVVIALPRSDPTHPYAPIDGHPSLLARLGGAPDAVARDDVAPVLGSEGAPVIGIVVGEGGAVEDQVATGGGVIERAFAALEGGAQVRPLTSIPDRDVDLQPLAGLVVDDPAGFLPETRVALRSWLDRGGVLLIALGPRASSPPLGANLEPLLERPLRWERVNGPLGISTTAPGPFADGVEAAHDLAPQGRARLDPEDLARTTTMSAFSDAIPLLVERSFGAGEAWLSTMPFSPSVSDLPLRPAFLALLDRFSSRVRDRAAGGRLEAGGAWSVALGDRLEADPIDDEGRAHAEHRLAIESTGDRLVVHPPTIGSYRVTTTSHGGPARVEVRAVTAAARECEMATHAIAAAAGTTSTSSTTQPSVELSGTLAMLLALLVAIELAIRIVRVATGRAPVDVER